EGDVVLPGDVALPPPRNGRGEGSRAMVPRGASFEPVAGILPELRLSRLVQVRQGADGALSVRAHGG
ncbi:unnamed protein product, partial [Symbiodinium necroappetens]